jgi:hypothetical protein
MRFQSIFLFLVFIVCGFNAISQPVPPGGPAVVITEIMYDMPGTADSLEFIELRNPSDTNERSLGGHSFVAGIEFSFPAQYIIQPQQYVVIAKDSVAFFNAFGVEAFQWDSGSLDDNGELIILHGPFNNPVDSVRYDTNILWPNASGNGKSIVFCNDTLDNQNPANWSAASSNTGVEVDGTLIYANPGADCSFTNAVSENRSNERFLYPNPNNGVFHLDLSNLSSKSLHELTIIDLNGKQVFYSAVRNLRQTINLTGFVPSGTYIVLLSNEHAIFRQRIVIME